MRFEKSSGILLLKLFITKYKQITDINVEIRAGRYFSNSKLLNLYDKTSTYLILHIWTSFDQ